MTEAQAADRQREIEREQQLEQAKRAVVAAVDTAIVTLRGSVEFRNAVEALLVGTPYEKPTDSRDDFEGLYGRLRAALRAGKVIA